MKTHPKIIEQYEKYPYPPRDPKNDNGGILPIVPDGLDMLNHHCFRGKLAPERLNILVAGCGTGDSGLYLAEQLRKTKSKIVCLDVSHKSLQIAKNRAERQNLKNIQWVQGSLLDIGKMGLGPFDYINCVGVLHHLESPREGLKVLANALKPLGAMLLMLYGKYGRTGVTRAANLIKLIAKNKKNWQDKISTTRSVLYSISRKPWLKNESEWVDAELAHYGDAGLADIFLCETQKTFGVPEIYDLVESAALNFVDFVGSRMESKIGYDPATHIPDPQTLSLVRTLPPQDQQAISELWGGTLRKHVFYLSKAKNTVARFENRDNIPVLSQGTKASEISEFFKKNPGKKITVSLDLGVQVTFSPKKFTWQIFQHMDGQRSFGEIFSKIRSEQKIKIENHVFFRDFSKIFKHLNMAHALFLRHKSRSSDFQKLNLYSNWAK